MPQRILIDGPTVVIDGVVYVPVNTNTSMSKVLTALALQYHTPETLLEYGTDNLRIVVGDSSDFRKEGETFQEFAARCFGPTNSESPVTVETKEIP